MSSGNKIGEFTEGHLMTVAKGVVAKKTANSKLLDVEAEARIPKFAWSGMSSKLALTSISLGAGASLTDAST
jgi:hypothetical protein